MAFGFVSDAAILTERNIGRGIVVVSVLLVLPVWAQNLPSEGLYQVLSGTYDECCGFVGMPVVYSLPQSNQAFVRLTFAEPSGTATMSILGDDRQTVFSRVPCQVSGALEFDFPYGLSLNDSYFFHVDPGPPPYGMYWNYTASNSIGVLRIDGTLGTTQGGCVDTPTQFNHSNVVAVLVMPPKLSVSGFSTNGLIRLLVQGTAGRTNVIEGSRDLSAWIPVSTNIMDYSVCPICPFAIFEDTQSTNYARRFYRVFELK